MSPLLLFGAALVGAAGPVAWWAVSTGSPANAGAALRRGFTPLDLREAQLARPTMERLVTPAVSGLARRARRLTPAGMMERLETRIATSGSLGRWTIEQILAAKLLVAAAFALLGLLRFAASPGLLTLLVAVGGPVAAWVLPDFLLDRRAQERAKQIQQELPDVMDQVMIAVEAGLGFEAALARVANGPGVLAGELARTLQDIQLGVARSDALAGLADRTDTTELRQFVTAIRQAERYGLPVANVLRVQSKDLREKRRQRAEEQAMKLPVKVLFPLVFCILPTLFLVILGPAGIRIVNGLG